LELLSRCEPSFRQQSRNLVNFITALNSNRLTKQMDSRIALVTQEFFIRLLKRLRYDVLDVWLHKNLKLMKRITECSGHNEDCSRHSGNRPDTTGDETCPNRNTALRYLRQRSDSGAINFSEA
jgi:hypothetical protein